MRKKFTLLIALLALCVNSWADPTVITWDETDLQSVNVPSLESQTLEGITVTNNADPAAGQYCHFYYQAAPADYCNFSMHSGGTLTFAPESGNLTSIVITCADLADDYLGAGDWWWDEENTQLKWTGNAASVVLRGNGLSNNFRCGPISSIVFTVSGYVPTSNITWDATDIASINVSVANGAVEEGANQSQTVDGVSVAAAASAPTNEEYNYAAFHYGGTIDVGYAGSLTFTAPANNNFRRIVITGNDCDNFPIFGSEYLPSGWTWSESTCQLTWSGGAASSVVLNSTDQEYGSINLQQIASIVFTVAETAPAPDTREVPELKFLNADIEMTETTIVRDMYDAIFEPGTYYAPSTEYNLYVNDGVVYDEYLQPIVTWSTPTEKGLSMTYSVPNNDVITLTKTSGDSFEFTVNGLGDAVVTASTDGNETYKPASTTFTIHVEYGKAATKECILYFVGGENDGQEVPADYKFELQTGDEIQQMELREKNNPYHPVYAPSHSIWGSQNYYVASLNGEKKLRALTAGDDVFRVQYARYSSGDMNDEFRTIEIPVHIKPSQPALVSSLDFASSPAGRPDIVFNGEYDGTSQQAQITGTLTNAEVKAAMNLWAYGTPGWSAALPNSFSFELPAGQGSFNITCAAQDGYEVRVLKFGDATAECFDNASPQEHTIEYDITDQKAVVIYVAEKSSPNNGPKRAPTAMKYAPLASFSTLAVSPTYPITAKADPDNTSKHYSTFFNSTQKYKLPVGTEAYVATISGEDMNLTKVADGGEVIPANTALILKSDNASVVLTPTDEAAVTISAPNILHGTDSEMPAPANCYVLSGHSTDNSVTGVGFYQFTGIVPAHKAYATISGGIASAPKKLRFIFDQATDIENTDAAMESIKRFENGQLIIIRNGIKYTAAGQIIK